MKLQVEFKQSIQAVIGYGVYFYIHYGYETHDCILDVEPEIVPVNEKNLTWIDGVPYLRNKNNFRIPVDHFKFRHELTYGDTHDFRSQFFLTEAEAQNHIDKIMEQWVTPEPWHSYVITDDD